MPDRQEVINMKKRIKIAEVPIDNLTYEEVLERIEGFIKNNQKAYIVTANPEMVLNASRDKNFLQVLNDAKLVTPDGIGILWAAHYLKKPLPKGRLSRYFQFYKSIFSILFSQKRLKNPIKERVTGVDLFRKIIELSENKAWRIFLLGASEGVAEKVIHKFSKIYPGAQFTGSFSGSPSAKEEEEICKYINKAKPDILFVAYGSPKQEIWIHRNLSRLNTVKTAVGVGGTFDFYAGKIKRAPKWMRKMGLEWLFRLIRQPKRICRIWNATVLFIRLVAKQKMKSRFVH